jgi:hypothetical protein
MICADAAYTDYASEDLLREEAALELIAALRGNSKRPQPGHVTYLCEQFCKRVEKTLSVIAQRFAKSLVGERSDEKDLGWIQIPPASCVSRIRLQSYSEFTKSRYMGV